MATRELDLRLSRQLCYYSFLDLPYCQGKAVPLRLVVVEATVSTKTTKGRFLGDLIHIALYFCLRSCEYTKTNWHKLTAQFRFCDLQFYDGSGILTFDAPALRIRRSMAVTLYLDTQKKSVRGEFITMEATGITVGYAVGTAAERFLHLRLYCVDLDTPICIYFSLIRSEGSSVTIRNVVAILRLWAGHIGFQRLGFRPNDI